jgi:hypothetical protein
MLLKVAFNTINIKPAINILAFLHDQVLKWSLVPPDFKECCIKYSWKLFKF